MFIKANFKRIIILVVLTTGIVSALSIGANLLKPKPKYNLILISVDTLRADHMGVYGYSKNTTPNIDRWAKTATVFTNMRTQVPATYPSFSIFMTGKSAFESGIFNNSLDYEGISEGFVPIDDEVITLAQILEKERYTVAYVNNPSLDGDLTSINKGFNIYENYTSWSPQEAMKRKMYKSLTTLNAGIEWLERNKNKKFFLWVHFMEPHAPYIPTEENLCKFNSKFCTEIKKRGLEDLENERNNLKLCQSEGLPTDKVELFETLYDGAIASADTLVSKILNKISGLGLDKNTIVIFYGDHGEGFSHNYYFMHGDNLYDSQIRIPFIVKAPPLKPKRIEMPLQNIQILPTLLDLLELTYDRNSYASSFEPLFYDKTYRAPRYTFSVNVGNSKFSIQNDRYKFIFSIPGRSCIVDSQIEELYDLKNDPNEIKNLASEKPGIAEKMKEELLSYLSKYNSSKRRGDNRNVPSDVIEKLKSIGY